VWDQTTYAKVDVSVSVKTTAHVGAKADRSAGVHDGGKTAGGKANATNSVICNGTGNASACGSKSFCTREGEREWECQ
jgi:hypothetical protein